MATTSLVDRLRPAWEHNIDRPCLDIVEEIAALLLLVFSCGRRCCIDGASSTFSFSSRLDGHLDSCYRLKSSGSCRRHVDENGEIVEIVTATEKLRKRGASNWLLSNLMQSTLFHTLSLFDTKGILRFSNPLATLPSNCVATTQ
ncbi:hypothetical protein MRB53_038355 [Persea americana]|nr:hypothetical protein MRB53_038355 [Persea americana]